MNKPWLVAGYSYGGAIDQVFHDWIGDIRIVDRPRPVEAFTTAHRRRSKPVGT